MYCGTCGESNPEEAKFCGKCGASQTAAVAPPGAVGVSDPADAEEPTGAAIAQIVGVLSVVFLLPISVIAFMSGDPAALSIVVVGFLYILIGVATIIIFLMGNWEIATKAGYHGALSLLMLVPLVNLAIFLIFAFGEWPVERELKGLRTRAVVK